MTEQDSNHSEFIISKSNRKAWERLSKHFSSKEEGGVVFLKGPNCSGKSLLIRELCEKYKVHNPNDIIMHENGESIIDKIVERSSASDENGVIELPLCDVLIVEDIDELAGKPATMSEVAECFINQKNQGVLVVVTFNSKTRGLESLIKKVNPHEMLSISKADSELRRQIIRSKMLEGGLVLDVKMIHHLARTKLNTSQLIGFIKTLSFMKEDDKSIIDMLLFKKALFEYQKQVR